MTIPAVAPAPAAAAAPGRPFARRVASVFGARVIVFGVGLTTTLVVNRLLGPDLKGAYVAVTSLPALLGTVGVFGIPNAINYFSARGISVRGLLLTAIFFVAVISAALTALMWVTLPWLETNFLSGAPKEVGLTTADQMLRLILITVPAGMIATFAGTILYGRHEVRLYTTIMVAQAIVTLVVLVTAVGVLRLGVWGAVEGTVIVSCLGALAVLAAVRHVAVRNPDGDPVPMRALVSYGARAYPAGITGYFNYRADTFIIQALMVAAQAPRALGLYSMAVTMAELIFYIPDAVTTIFLPTVAGSTAEAADAKLGRVSRLTVLATVSCSIALIPAAWAGVHLVLPKYDDCLPAFLVLLPGVVSLSLGKVMTSYIAGRGRPGPISVAAAITLVLNLAANVILIPQYGIVGASLASLISYTAMAALMVPVACRISGLSPAALVVPRKEEFLALRSIARLMVRRVSSRIRA
jgi:O-antigen/teichoic acid export membrane protein